MPQVPARPIVAVQCRWIIVATLNAFLWPGLAIAEPTIAARWNQTLLEVVKSTRSSDVVTARALAVVHTAMFDAWACYDDKALATQTGAAWRRPASERSAANKEKAVSYAAFRALVDLFPSQQDKLTQALTAMGYDPQDATSDPATAAGIGNLAARMVLYARQRDGANQLGD